MRRRVVRRAAPQVQRRRGEREEQRRGEHEAAHSVAKHGVTGNAIGTNFLDYPGFVKANGADDPAVRMQLESRVPLGRLGECAEIAHFCASLLDGGNRFQTGQFFSLSGGWSD